VSAARPRSSRSRARPRPRARPGAWAAASDPPWGSPKRGPPGELLRQSQPRPPRPHKARRGSRGPKAPSRSATATISSTPGFSWPRPPWSRRPAHCRRRETPACKASCPAGAITIAMEAGRVPVNPKRRVGRKNRVHGLPFRGHGNHRGRRDGARRGAQAGGP
jgi:ferredoxin